MTKSTTKKDFKLFESECRKWIKKMSLGDWDVDFFHSDREGALASTRANWSGKSAAITFNTEWDEEYYNNKQIKITALHEALELLLMELRVLASSRYLAEPDIDHATHTVIQRMVNMLKEDS